MQAHNVPVPNPTHPPIMTPKPAASWQAYTHPIWLLTNGWITNIRTNSMVQKLLSHSTLYRLLYWLWIYWTRRSFISNWNCQKKHNPKITHAGQYNAGGSPLKDHHTLIHMRICILPPKCLTKILFLPPFSHQHRPGISSILMKTHKYEIFTGLFPWESPSLLTFTQFAMDYYHLFHQPSKNTHKSPTNKSVLWIWLFSEAYSNVKLMSNFIVWRFLSQSLLLSSW